MRKFLREFKEFALRGNVLDLAVGVIIGASFQGIVTSLTNNILSPILGLFTGNNFEALHLVIFNDVDIMYGAFITSVINFVIMSFIVFLIIKFVNRVAVLHKKPVEPAAPTTRACPYCMTDISIKATRCPACTSNITG